MQTLSLNDTWDLRYCDPGEGERLGWPAVGVGGREALAAAVPGDVHLDLAAAGLIGEPLYGLNAADCAWMEEKDWWFSRRFDVPGWFGGDRIELHFAGLDTTADIWLNGRRVGSHNSMFVGCTADVTSLVQPGPNLLVVRVDAGLRQTRGKEVEKYAAMGSANRAPFMWVRKASFSWEWDWSPRLLTCGIWRGVELRGYRRAALRDLYLHTRLAADGSAEVTATLEVESFVTERQEATIEITLSGHGKHTTALPATLEPGVQTLTGRLRIPQPALWWPAPLGQPNLYDCRVALVVSGEIVDESALRYGLREVALIQEPLPGDEGTSFTFAVNGQRVFCKGANWSPADALPARTTPAKYRELVRLAADANFNMFRVNGVGIIEDPCFYDLCDEFGILVWSEFNYACSYYPDDDPAFLAATRQEAEKIVRALRNHACIALWCGTNENLWHHYRGQQLGWAADRCYGAILYHEGLPEVCGRLHPDCPYWPGSPWGADADPNSETTGNRHSWQVSILAPSPTEREDFGRYAADRGKFISEFGILGPCALESVPQFLAPADMARGSPGWTYHANSIERGAGNVPEALRRYWRPIAELSPAEYVAFGQLLQAEGLKFAIEHWRRRKFNTSGTLFWNYADCWGATVGWTVVDYYLRKKAAYDAVRRAYAPLLASIEHAGDRLRFWLVNDTLQAVDGVLEYGLCELPTSRVQAFARPATASANAAACIAELDIASILPEEAGRWATYTRFVAGGEVISRSRLFLAGFYLNRLVLPQAVFSQQVSDDVLVLRADTFVWQIHVEAPPGMRVEDNHFDLFPGEERRLRLSGPARLFGRVHAVAMNPAISTSRQSARTI
jgi:beta-mannosidase